LIVAVGSDHAGYELKEKIKSLLEDMHMQYMDVGSDSKDSVDYPDFAVKVARSITNSQADRGILVCASGIGMSIVANKIPGIRAALCTTEEQAEYSRRHNDANIIALGAKITTPNVAKRLVRLFLETEPDGQERHRRRIKKIHELTGK